MKRGLWISIVAGSLGVTWFAMVQGMPLKMFMEALGASGTMIGLVTMVMQVALVAQLPGALLARQLQSRKRLWACVSFGSRLLWFLPLLLLSLFPGRPVMIAWGMVIITAVTSLLNQSVTAFWFSWMMDLIPERIRGQFWGTRQSCTMFAFLLAMAVTGYILDYFPAPGNPGGSWWGFEIVFVVGTLFGCVDVLIHLLVPEPKIHPDKGNPQWLKRALAPLRDRDFRRLTITMGIYTFSVGLVSLGIIYLKRDFGVNYSHLSAITIASSLGIVVFGVVTGQILDRIGGRAFGAIMAALIPLPAFVWFFIKNQQTNIVDLMEGVWILGPGLKMLVTALPAGLEQFILNGVLPQSIWLLLFVCFISGSLYGGLNLAQLNLNSLILPERGRTMAMAVHWSIVGLIGAFGALLGGWVMDYFAENPMDYFLPTGTRFSFHHVLVIAHMVIMWFLVFPMLLSLRRRQGEPHVAEAFSRLLVSNPIRAVTNIYMLSSATRGKRAAAARQLGEKRTTIAVSDLIEKLDDASADVREEATLALGTIGSEDAIDALLRKMEDPHSDLAPQIARALRVSRHRKGVPTLLKRLRDPDRETKSESARALGEIGDPRAVPSLLSVLAEANDPKIISSSSEALARLGSVAAIYEILPRMRATRNPVLKRSLAVAIGDLLGEPEGFYKVLTREQQTRGSEIGRMLKELRRDIRHATRLDLSEQGGLLQEQTRHIEWLYDEEDYEKCFLRIFDLTIGLAALAWGVEYGGNSKAMVNELIWHDQRFGIGAWCLDLLRQSRQGGEQPGVDEVDSLLGIYFLSCRAFAKE